MRKRWLAYAEKIVRICEYATEEKSDMRRRKYPIIVNDPIKTVKTVGATAQDLLKSFRSLLAASTHLHHPAASRTEMYVDTSAYLRECLLLATLLHFTLF